MSSWFIVVLAMMAQTGCDESALPPTPARDSAARVEAKPPSVEDRSEAPPWYLGKGVPSTATTWTASELAEAVKATTVIADRELEKMPRFRGPSGPVFARLVDTSAAEAEARDDDGPVRQLLELSSWFEPIATLSKLYARRDTKGRGFPAELARVTAAALDLLRLMHAPIEQTRPPTESAARQAYESGLRQIRTGATETLMGAAMMLSDPKRLAAEDRRLLAGAVARCLTEASGLLPPEAHEPLTAQLELLIVGEKDAVVKAKLAEAAKALDG